MGARRGMCGNTKIFRHETHFQRICLESANELQKNEHHLAVKYVVPHTCAQDLLFSAGGLRFVSLRARVTRSRSVLLEHSNNYGAVRACVRKVHKSVGECVCECVCACAVRYEKA